MESLKIKVLLYMIFINRKYIKNIYIVVVVKIYWYYKKNYV